MHGHGFAPTLRRWGPVLAGLMAAVMALCLAVVALAPPGSRASSHREAPLISNDPQADTTDVYAFRSPDRPNTVTLVANWLPFSEPAGGPNFYAFADKARYDIRIDNNGDARADIIYRWNFDDHYRTRDTFLYNTGPVTSLTDANLNFYQTYDLWEIRPGSGRKLLIDDGIAAPSHVGRASIPNYSRLRDQAILDLRGEEGRTYAGQADDPFFLDLRVFDLLYGGDFSEVGDDTLAGFNVNTVVLQVPRSDLARGGRVAKHHVIGVWSTTSRRTVRVLRPNGEQIHRGGFAQVSRLGHPLVNEVVVPLRDKDKFNASRPSNDVQFLDYVTNPELPRLIELIYGIDAPGTPRNDLVSVFLTGVKGLNQPANVNPSEQLRLNMIVPVCRPATCDSYSRLGVVGGDNAGYPNGRRLADDVVDIALQVVEGELVGRPNDLGDAVLRNDVRFSARFPYIALPHPGSDPRPHAP